MRPLPVQIAVRTAVQVAALLLAVSPARAAPPPRVVAVFDIENGKSTVQVQSLVAVLGVLNIRIEANGPFSIEFESLGAMHD